MRQVLCHAQVYFIHWISKFSLVTHLGWPIDIDLGLRSVLLLKVSGSIISGANLGGLI